MDFKSFCDQLERKIQATYEEGVSPEQAEKLAAEFLRAMMVVSEELKKKDLDSRMRKSGVKAVRAKVYLTIVDKAEKKPTETQIASMIDVDSIVCSEQDSLDNAEVARDDLKRYYDVFQHAHVFFRGVAKGQFNG
jgi:hypothetical protein